MSSLTTPAVNAASGGLRIAVIAPPWFELPPRGYGGVEAVVAHLVDQLVLRGHEVTLVASGAHGTLAQRAYRVYEMAPSERLGTPQPEVAQAAAAAALIDELDVDLVHDHSLAGPLTARGRVVPTGRDRAHAPDRGLRARLPVPGPSWRASAANRGRRRSSTPRSPRAWAPMPEVVPHGVGGYVVNDLHDMPAVAAADDLDPLACRRIAEHRFDLPVMAARYEALYQDILDQRLVRPRTRCQTNRWMVSPSEKLCRTYNL